MNGRLGLRQERGEGGGGGGGGGGGQKGNFKIKFLMVGFQCCFFYLNLFKSNPLKEKVAFQTQ